jgi:hypothetical protein
MQSPRQPLARRRPTVPRLAHLARALRQPASAVVDTSKFRENANQPTQRREKSLCTLSDSQVAQYHERGWVTPEQFRIPASTLELIRADHARFVERFRGTHPEFEDYCGAILNYDLAFLNYARDPHILNMVEQCIGPDIALWNSSFFAKPPRAGRRVPWHQDGWVANIGLALPPSLLCPLTPPLCVLSLRREYWPIRPLATCTVWMAIDDCTLENGCLQMVPGSVSSGIPTALFCLPHVLTCGHVTSTRLGWSSTRQFTTQPSSPWAKRPS